MGWLGKRKEKFPNSAPFSQILKAYQHTSRSRNDIAQPLQCSSLNQEEVTDPAVWNSRHHSVDFPRQQRFHPPELRQRPLKRPGCASHLEAGVALGQQMVQLLAYGLQDLTRLLGCGRQCYWYCLLVHPMLQSLAPGLIKAKKERQSMTKCQFSFHHSLPHMLHRICISPVPAISTFRDRRHCTTVATIIHFSPGHNAPIRPDCSKSMQRRLDLVHILVADYRVYDMTGD